MPGFNNEIMYADNVRFDGAKSPGQVTADGDLLIGSTVAPNIRVGSLTSSDSSITITPGAGTIDLAAGAIMPVTFTEDAGSAAPALSNLNVFGATSTGGTATNINTIGAGATVSVCLNNSISQPTTNAAGTEGVYSLGGGSFLHNYSSIGLAGGNSFLGGGAGNLSTTGQQTTGIGFGCLPAQTNGGYNTAVGYHSLLTLTSGIANVLIGAQTGEAITTGNSNVGIGYQSLLNCNGSENVAVGIGTINDASTGSDNTFVGNYAGRHIGAGSFNLGLGGASGGAYVGAESSNVCIANSGVVGESNKIRIGTQGAGNGQQNACYIAGIASVSTANSQYVTVNTATGQLGSQAIKFQQAKITLNAADIRALDITPITLIPAQGANTVIVPLMASAKFVYGGSNQFTGGSAISLNYDGTTTLQIGSIYPASDIDAAVTSYATSQLAPGLPPSATGETDNVDVIITTSLAFGGNAADDNSLIIDVSYYVTTLT